MWLCTRVRMLGVGNYHYDDYPPHHSRASSSSSNWRSIFGYWVAVDWHKNRPAVGTVVAVVVGRLVLVLDNCLVLGRVLVHVLFRLRGHTADILGMAVDIVEAGLDTLVRAVRAVLDSKLVQAVPVDILAVPVLALAAHMLVVLLGRRWLEGFEFGL